jgi:hypothetical protein
VARGITSGDLVRGYCQIPVFAGMYLLNPKVGLYGSLVINSQVNDSLWLQAEMEWGLKIPQLFLHNDILHDYRGAHNPAALPLAL